MRHIKGNVMVFTHPTPAWLKAVKPFGYCLIFALMLLPLLSLYLVDTGALGGLNLYFTPIFVFVITPILDLLMGHDEDNHGPEESKSLSTSNYYKFLPMLCAPCYLLLLVWSCSVYTSGDLHWVAQLGWVLSIGTLGGVVGINVAHELVHKNTAAERFCGGMLLSMVTYAGFKIEHIRHHHVMASTPEDPSSSRFNESLYSFFLRAIPGNFYNAWAHEAERLRKKGLNPYSFLSNELIHWYSLSAAFAIILTLLFGWEGLVFFLAQSVCAAILLETVNYVEHYGLERRRLPNGKYEKVTPKHSWNSTVFWSSLYLFQLPRHSDHHAYASRRYQVLRHHEDAPRHPYGYPAMILLAILPPLWFRVMNPQVEEWKKAQ